jgi:hypothetical protein
MIRIVGCKLESEHQRQQGVSGECAKTINKEQTFMIAPQITTSPLETFAPSEVFFPRGGATLLKAPPLQSLSINTPTKDRYVRKAHEKLQSNLLSELLLPSHGLPRFWLSMTVCYEIHERVEPPLRDQSLTPSSIPTHQKNA